MKNRNIRSDFGGKFRASRLRLNLRLLARRFWSAAVPGRSNVRGSEGSRNSADFRRSTVSAPEYGRTPFGWLAALVVLAVVLTFTALPARAAVTEAWVQRYNSVQGRGANDLPSKGVLDATGDIIVAARTDNNTTGFDILVIKYSGANGAVIWQHRYNGPGNKPDGPTALKLDRHGNVVVAGHSSNGTNSDIYTAKYSGLDGTLIWENLYVGPANGDDSATAVAVDQSGNVFVTGFSSTVGQTNHNNFPSYSGPRDFYTAKYAAADGALLWERRYDGSAKGSVSPRAMAIDGDGNLVVTGSSIGANSASDFYTAKYAGTDGALLWERRSDGPLNEGYSAADVTVDFNGDFVVTGASYQTDAGSDSTVDYYTAKYAAADGALLWEQRYNGPGNSYDAATAVLADNLGDVIVTGVSRGIGDVSGFYTAKYAAADGALLWGRWSTNGGSLLSLDGRGNIVMAGREYIGGTTVGVFSASDGALVWERNFRQAQLDAPAAVAISDSGDVVVVRAIGYVYDNYDFFTSKMANDGRVLWQQKFDGPANAYDSARGLVIDQNGNVVVTGTAITAKYAATNGAQLWEKPAGDLIAIDAAGNIVVVGFFQIGSEFDLSIVKYSVDGETFWEQHRRGPYQLFEKAAAMVLDRDGNVIVTGEALKLHGNPYGADYFTAKYDANDGALLWENFYNGLADHDDLAEAVAVDREGNVFVTGVAGSSLINGFGNYYTVKYAATDGRFLWEQLYFGSADGSDSASAIAVDGSGNVIVTGSSSKGTKTDYATLKYAAADGAVLWERRFNGPANGDDEPTALAVDSNGDVIVTGYSSGSDHVTDFYTAKYEAASGVVLWEKRYHNPANSCGRGQKVAVDENGNAIVAGYSGGSYYTAKYATADGALLWEERLDIPPNRSAYVGGLGIGPDGMVAVTGQYGVSFHDNAAEYDLDYVTIVYRENRPPVIGCPSNVIEIATTGSGAPVEFTVNATDDSGVPPAVTCVPPGGSVFPIGQTTVICTATDGDGLSSTCSFPVTVRGARGVKENVLAELIALRATVTDRDDGRQLDEAIAHLTQSLAAEFWVDETHLERKHGGKVFHEEKETVRNLCDLIQSRKSLLPDAVLQAFVDRLIQVDRLLASVAIGDAITTGMSGNKIEQAQKFLAQGDAEGADGKCANGIEEYRKAWKRAARAKVSPPVRLANGRVRLEIAGEAGERFTIQFSSNLKDWLTLSIRPANAEGLVTFEDADPRPHPTRFYRVISE